MVLMPLGRFVSLYCMKDGDFIMAKDRITPCFFYVCAGTCKKGREADHAHYCQKCDKYRPRVKERHLNRKKDELDKIRKKELY